MKELSYLYKEVDPRSLKLGAQFTNVWYDWRPYSERTREARSDYDRLELDMQRLGVITNPVIVFNQSVLIGMRRTEIAIKLGWNKIPIWDIQTDITDDLTPDRVFSLRDKYKEAKY